MADDDDDEEIIFAPVSYYGDDGLHYQIPIKRSDMYVEHRSDDGWFVFASFILPVKNLKMKNPWRYLWAGPFLSRGHALEYIAAGGPPCRPAWAKREITAGLPGCDFAALLFGQTADVNVKELVWDQWREQNGLGDVPDSGHPF